MSKTTPPNSHKKLVKEILLLAVIVVAVTGLSLWRYGAPKQTKPVSITKLDTTFDSSAAAKLDERDKAYPIAPDSGGDFGKGDVFH